MGDAGHADASQASVGASGGARAGRWRRREALGVEAQVAETEAKAPIQAHPVDTDPTPETAGTQQTNHGLQHTSKEIERCSDAYSVGEAPIKIGFHTTLKLRSGGCLPLLGLGTWQLKADCRKAVEAALRCGYRLVDTATVYGNEEDVGKGLRGAGIRRQEVFLCTKLPSTCHGSFDTVRDALASSLSRLGTDYIDLYLVHSPAGGSIIETWEAMLQLRALGLAKAVGVSNFGTQQLQCLAMEGCELPEVNQIELHFALQQRETVAYCKQHGIAVMAYSPLARGRLFGSTALEGIASRRGRTEAEVAIRWCLQKGYVTIPKSKNVARIESNAALGFSLSDSEMSKINALNCGRKVGKAVEDMELSWDDIAYGASESEQEGEGSPSPDQPGKGKARRRRRRRAPAKGKGKSGGAGAGYPSGKGGGSHARWTEMLSSLC